jgi:hypothetical protein
MFKLLLLNKGSFDLEFVQQRDGPCKIFAIDAECSRALLLTPSFSRVQKAKRSSRFQRLSCAARTVETVSASVVAHTGLKPGVNTSSRFMFKNVCSPMRTLPDSLPTRLMKTPSLLGLTVAQYAAFAVGLVFLAAAGSRVITFQEAGDASSDIKQQLIGRWRKTTSFREPKRRTPGPSC